ncbi:MAG: superoxide dismutase [Candidatus Vogelbacteria bacterium]|nr:superoxide dismutase [Candidatus Vogelbacteria bacterium]
MYEIPNLPYKYTDLEPYFDEATMKVHQLKHHQTYADKLNAALEGHPDLAEKDLIALIRRADKDIPVEIRPTIVNNGGGYLNHSFFWEILGKPAKPDNKPDGTTIGVALEDQFGSYDDFKKKFSERALALFGSGWTWLLIDVDGKLSIENTANQNLPEEKKVALLVLDLWEHAYYLKYQNRRAEYIEAFYHVIDWKAVDAKLKQSGITPAEIKA